MLDHRSTRRVNQRGITSPPYREPSIFCSIRRIGTVSQNILARLSEITQLYSAASARINPNTSQLLPDTLSPFAFGLRHRRSLSSTCMAIIAKLGDGAKCVRDVQEGIACAILLSNSAPPRLDKAATLSFRAEFLARLRSIGKACRAPHRRHAASARHSR